MLRSGIGLEGALPTDLEVLLAHYLDVKSMVHLRQTCHHFLELELPDKYWEDAVRKELGGDPTLVILNEGVMWEDVVRELWQGLKIDWFEVVSDPYFFEVGSFLHINSSGSTDAHMIFGASKGQRSIQNLMDWEGLFNCFGEGDEFESLFDPDSSVEDFITGIGSFNFTLPGGHHLRFCISAEVSGSLVSLRVTDPRASTSPSIISTSAGSMVTNACLR
jgi:hypothetical protein